MRRLAAAVSVAAILWGSGVLWFGTVSELLIGYANRSQGVLLEEPRASVFLPPNRAKLFSEVLARIRAMSAPGEPVLMAPYVPMFGFIAERPNPTRYAALYSVLLDPDRQQEVIAALEEGPTRLRQNQLEVFIPGLGVAYEMSRRHHLFAGVHRGFAPPL